MQVGGVHNLYLWQLNALVSLRQLHKAVLARAGVVIGLKRWGGGAKENLFTIQ